MDTVETNRPLNRRMFLSALTMGTASLIVPAGRTFAADDPLKMRALYNKDLSFSAQAWSLENSRIKVGGFMAPPLKAESTFFVLTKKPMAVCPFCETDAEWPDDILAIYTKRIITIVPFNVPIIVSGVLKLGTFKDPHTGFVSRVRLMDASYGRR